MLNIISFFKKNYFILIEVIFLLIVSLTPLLWFIPNHMVLGLDSGYPVDFISRFHERLFTWFSPYAFGLDMTSTLGQIPLFGLLAFVRWIGFSIYSVQKITFVFWFFAMALSMYAFVFYLFPKAKFWIIRLIAVFIYVFNFHLLSFWIQGSQSTFSSYVFLPILSLLLIKFFKKEISALKAAILINVGYLFFNAGGVLGIPLLGPSIITGFTIFIFYLLILWQEEKMQLVKRIIFLTFYSLVIFLLFNAYFILPFLNSFGQQYAAQVGSGSTGIESAVGWNQYISRHVSYVHLFRLQGDNSWYENPYLYSQAYIHNPFLIFASFLFPILAYISIFLVKEKKEKILVTLLMLISLVAILFSAGAHSPFGFLYTWAIRHIPGFAAFRSGYYKFIPALYFSFSVLIGISIFYISERLRKNYKFLFGFLALISVLIYHYPFFQATRLFNYDYPFTTMVKPPDYIFDYMKFEKTLNDDSRILALPPYSNTTDLKAYEWGYVSGSSLFLQVAQKSFVYNNSGLSSPESKLVDSLYKSIKDDNLNRFTYFAKLLDIGYVIVTSDIANNYNSAKTEDPILYKTIIDKNINLFARVWSKGPWSIYKINVDNAPKKISALSNLSLYNSFDYAKSISVAENNQFVLEDQFSGNLNGQILSKLPISSRINVIPCVSCLSVSNEDLSDFGYSSKVIPGSLFYPLKLFLEEYGLNKKKDFYEQLDSYLGLSMKRVVEIRQQASRDSAVNAYDWNDSLSLLWHYWDEIYGSINSLSTNNKRDFELLNKIYRYAELEVEIISNAYNYIFKDSDMLKIKLENILWEISKKDPFVSNLLLQYNFNNKFSYDISSAAVSSKDIRLDTSSLPRDINNNPIFPSKYEVDDKVPSVPDKISQNDIAIYNIEKDNKNLTLYFNNIPNLSTEYKDIVLRFPTFTKNCMYSSVKNYNWQNNYYIQGNIQKINKDVYIYVKRERDEMITNKSGRKYSSFFIPDDSFMINDPEVKTFKYQLSGKSGDKGVSLYFCTNLNENPRDIFTNVNVNQIFQPSIYNLENYNLAKNMAPSIEYKKKNPTSYTVAISNATDKYVLSFLERFSPLWKARYLDDGQEVNNHFMINGYANGWLIDKKGSYSLEIYFSSQSAFEKGVVVTVVSVGALLLLFVLGKAVSLYKSYGNKRKTN